MGTLFIQKRWFKPKKNTDGSEVTNNRSSCLQAGFCIVIAIGIKLYLQFLFTIGAFMARSWVDKHIKVCYNRLDSLDSNYDKSTRNQWYK